MYVVFMAIIVVFLEYKVSSKVDIVIVQVKLSQMPIDDGSKD